MRRQSRISTYQMGNPSPQAVGIPQTNNSAAIIGQGIQNLGAALQKRQEKADAVAAAAKFGDFNLAYSTMKAEFQKQYRDNPSEYTSAAKNQAENLINGFTEGMGSGVAEKFRAFATNYVAQDVDGLVNWATARDQEIIVGNIKKSYGDLAIAAEATNTPEGLQTLLKGLDNASQLASPFISEASNMALKETTRKDIVESALNGAMMSDPTRAYSMLANRKYQDLLTPNEERLYLNRAKEMMVNNAVLNQFKNLATSAVELSDIKDQVMNGQITPADINRRLTWATLNRGKTDATGNPIISENYIRGLQALKDASLGLDSRSQQQKAMDQGTFLQKYEEKKAAFLSGRAKGQKMAPSEYDDVIGLYADILEAHNSGIVSDEKFYEQKKILDTKLSSNLSRRVLMKSLPDALQSAGTNKNRWFWESPVFDVYSAGYKMIRDHVNKRTDLSPVEKTEFTDQLLLRYTEVIKNYPEEKVNGIKSVQLLPFANRVLNGTSDQPGLISQLAVYKNPMNGQPLMVGDRITNGNGDVGIFRGVNDKGVMVVVPVKKPSEKSK